MSAALCLVQLRCHDTNGLGKERQRLAARYADSKLQKIAVSSLR
jgi:hypothetical protein